MNTQGHDVGAFGPSWLDEHPLGQSARKRLALRAFDSFSRYFSDDEKNSLTTRTLAWFASTPPWTYWRHETIAPALQVLEEQPERAYSALTRWSEPIGAAVKTLTHPGGCLSDEEGIAATSPSALIRLANEFHPEYLKYAEHGFGNLIRLFWHSKTGKSGKFGLKSACAALKSNGLDRLLSGYNESVRNALAHGRVVFRGDGVRYHSDDSHFEEFTPNEFLHLFDELIETTHSLFIAVLLFCLRNRSRALGESPPHLPHDLAVFIAASSVRRPGFEIVGSVEAEHPLTGKQLQLSLKTNSRSQRMAFLDTLCLAAELYRFGVSQYERITFELDQGEPVSSMTSLRYEKLENFMGDGAKVSDLPELFNDTQLLWFDEHPWKTRARFYYREMGQILRTCGDEILRNFHQGEIGRALRRYEVKRVKRLLPDRTLRIEICVVLKYPSDAEDSEMLKEILVSVVRRFRRLFYSPPRELFVRQVPLPRRPSYVWVKLYRKNASQRCLDSRGWFGTNLLAIAEWKRSPRLESVYLKNPEAVHRDIGMRFGLDHEEWEDAAVQMAQVVNRMSVLKTTANIDDEK